VIVLTDTSVWMRFLAKMIELDANRHVRPRIVSD
jgi:hypothetical protein